MIIDPTVNAELIKIFRRDAKTQERTADSLYAVNGHEIHTHPDLVGRLKKLKEHLSDAEFDYVFGMAVLSSPSGRIFAVGIGSSSLALRLPDDEEWGRPYPEYGSQWRCGAAWGPRSGEPGEDIVLAAVRRAYSLSREM